MHTLLSTSTVNDISTYDQKFKIKLNATLERKQNKTKTKKKTPLTTKYMQDRVFRQLESVTCYKKF